jgi:hypothetical protein
MPIQKSDGYIYGTVVYGSILVFTSNGMEVLTIEEAGQELGGN